MTQPAAPEQDENKLIAERREKLKSLREAQAASGAIAFPNDFKPNHRAARVHQEHGAIEREAFEAAIAAGEKIDVSVAGRMMLKRVMGKASFATLQDGSFGKTHGRIQLFISRDALGEAGYDAFKHYDLGDILGAEGTLFKTRTGELSVKVTTLRLLTKNLRPLACLIQVNGLAPVVESRRIHVYRLQPQAPTTLMLKPAAHPVVVKFQW